MSRHNNREKPFKSSVDYFERVIRGHTAVASLNEIHENIYEIERTGRRSNIKVLVVDIYVVSQADIFEIKAVNDDITCILLIGFYNRYSIDAKQKAKSEKIGLFDMTEFFGAINYSGQNLINYEVKTKNN